MLLAFVHFTCNLIQLMDQHSHTHICKSPIFRSNVAIGMYFLEMNSVLFEALERCVNAFLYRIFIERTETYQTNICALVLRSRMAVRCSIERTDLFVFCSLHTRFSLTEYRVHKHTLQFFFKISIASTNFIALRTCMLHSAVVEEQIQHSFNRHIANMFYCNIRLLLQLVHFSNYTLY